MPDLLTSASAELGVLPLIIEGLTRRLDGASWRRRPVAGEWSPLELMCHLRDEESEDFGARLRAITEDGTGYKRNDAEAWVGERRYNEDDPAAVLSTFRERRAASLVLLSDLASKPERLLRRIEPPHGAGLSGLDILAAWVAHDRLHLAQLSNTLARLWAERWSPLAVEYAGDLPYRED
jgi:hypothetical protein